MQDEDAFRRYLEDDHITAKGRGLSRGSANSYVSYMRGVERLLRLPADSEIADEGTIESLVVQLADAGAGIGLADSTLDNYATALRRYSEHRRHARASVGHASL